MVPQAWLALVGANELSLGGDRFTDFALIGAPLTALCFVLQLVLIPIFFPL